MIKIEALRPVIPIKIFKDKNVSPIMLKLYIYVNELAFLGGCTKSTKTLSLELQMDERNIIRYLSKLIDAGYLIRAVRNDNERIITLPALGEKPDFGILPDVSYKDFRNILRAHVVENGVIQIPDSDYILRVDKYDKVVLYHVIDGYLRREQSDLIWHDMYRKRNFYLDKYIKPLQAARINNLKGRK
jgi:hypothetical protein